LDTCYPGWSDECPARDFQPLESADLSPNVGNDFCYSSVDKKTGRWMDPVVIRSIPVRDPRRHMDPGAPCFVPKQRAAAPEVVVPVPTAGGEEVATSSQMVVATVKMFDRVCDLTRELLCSIDTDDFRRFTLIAMGVEQPCKLTVGRGASKADFISFEDHSREIEDSCAFLPSFLLSAYEFEYVIDSSIGVMRGDMHLVDVYTMLSAFTVAVALSICYLHLSLAFLRLRFGIHAYKVFFHNVSNICSLDNLSVHPGGVNKPFWLILIQQLKSFCGSQLPYYNSNTVDLEYVPD